MDKEILILLTSDVEAQMRLINNIFSKLEERAQGLQPDDEARLESAAYQIHNLYNAIEDLFKVIADYFENQLSDTPHWHIRLLRRMSHDIAGVRPALLSEESYLLLNSLRSFRHFFRHAYAAPIDYEQLTINLDKARRLHPLIERDVARFLRSVGEE
jgi:hypothetical protein